MMIPSQARTISTSKCLSQKLSNLSKTWNGSENPSLAAIHYSPISKTIAVPVEGRHTAMIDKSKYTSDKHGSIFVSKYLRSQIRYQGNRTRTHCRSSSILQLRLEQVTIYGHTDKEPESILRHKRSYCTSHIEVDDKLVQTDEIKKFLKQNTIAVDEGYTCFVMTCPKFTTKRLKTKEIDKLFINMKTGYFVCQSCHQSGTWCQLKTNINLLQNQAKFKRKMDCLTFQSEVEERDTSRLTEIWQGATEVSQSDPEKLQLLLHNLNILKLKLPVLQNYKVRMTQEEDGLVFPCFNTEGTLLSVRVMRYVVNASGQPKITERTFPRVPTGGLFGLQTLRHDASEVILTSSELETMAAFQETRVPAVSLTKNLSSLPQHVLPLLEQFKKITLWFGNDLQSWETAKRFAKKLNSRRCYIIRPTEDNPSPLESMRVGLPLPTIYRNSKPLMHKSITSFSYLRQEVFNEMLHAEEASGIKWNRYPELNKLLKGHRRGELTVFTGPTGSGKTTFISDYSLDLALQGVSTLWGSFEINNLKLMKVILNQLSGFNMTKNLEKFEEAADMFETIPMHFMTFHGEESITRVIETMSHAVYIHDIAHVIIDNLQFMMGSTTGTSMDKFQKQDQIISACRKFATNMNCHITLVIHPRKESDHELLTTASIFGSAKASQEADNIMILQDTRMSSARGKKFIQVTKNRFDGELGTMVLHFDKESQSFSRKFRQKREEELKKKDEQRKKAEEQIAVPNENHDQTEIKNETEVTEKSED
ncbi:unnamed protein product [Owenia fusiformis]|uniref:DNA 5'-3' helicase n=1 Tax=Owenia fusiformis TaxID=6347 RepID=A0A8J1UMD1_OWEFU|nr:unnamed protein product [Owenia fusiformis]